MNLFSVYALFSKCTYNQAPDDLCSNLLFHKIEVTFKGNSNHIKI